MREERFEPLFSKPKKVEELENFEREIKTKNNLYRAVESCERFLISLLTFA